jgi:D-threo-aldose 1-dehydrogenase
VTASPSPIPSRRLGRTGLEVTVVGVGGWLGALEDPAATAAVREAAGIAAVRRAVDLGITYFDTSPSYGDAERMLGRGLLTLDAAQRRRLRIATKAGTHPQRSYRYDGDSIRWSVERSLGLLYTDRVDVLLVHDPRSAAEMDAVMAGGGALEALEALKAQGVVGAIGIGVRDHAILRRAIESDRFDVVLTPYDFSLVRDSARPVIDLAAGRDVGVVNGSPYVAGLLAGLDPAQAVKRRSTVEPIDFDRARRLWHWCRERDLDLGAVAMQYSLRHPAIAVTLVGPRTPAEVEGNVRHATTALPPTIWDDLRPLLDRFAAESAAGKTEE